MKKVNRSLDSKVTCLRMEGIYILLLGLWVFLALMILFICLKLNIPPFVMMLILFTSTTAVVVHLVKASEQGNLMKKKAISKRLNYYICKR